MTIKHLWRRWRRPVSVTWPVDPARRERVIETQLMELPEMTRAIFIARRFHGLSRAEIATQAGISVKAVDRHLARAVEHFWRASGGDGPPD